MDGYGTIYKATSKTSGKSYIGQTIDPVRLRKTHHKSKAKCGSKQVFHKAIRKYGWEDFEWEELYINVPVNQLDIMETWSIANHNTLVNNGYNCETGGNKNKRLSEETKKKISASEKGKEISEWHKNIISESNKERYKDPKNHPMFGKKHSEESKKKISNSLEGEKNPFFGKKHTKETKNKISENHADFSGENHPQYGKHRTEETKRKISDGRAKFEWEVINPEGEIFIVKSIAMYCKDNNLSDTIKGKLYLIANGKIKEYMGYRCKKLKSINQKEKDNEDGK